MDFSGYVRAWAEKAGKRAFDVVRATELDVSSSVIMMTPVDNGFARGSWMPTIGSPSSEEPGVADTGGSLAIARLETLLSQASKTGHLFYLTSNIPYIRRLEYGTYGRGKGATEKTGGTGYSRQAPGGMVRISAMRFKQAIRRALREVR